MVGAERMTEPNVLGNISPAKFLFDSGNTEIINLWKPSRNNAVETLHYPDSGTENGQDYQVPVGKVFYLLFFQVSYSTSNTTVNIQSNTSVDTSTGGTTLWKNAISDNDPSSSAPIDIQSYDLCLKFVAGEYITEYMSYSGNDMFCVAWGVECDA